MWNIFAFLLAIFLMLAWIPPGQRGYEGRPGNQGGNSISDQTGYEGQPGNQSGSNQAGQQGYEGRPGNQSNGK